MAELKQQMPEGTEQNPPAPENPEGQENAKKTHVLGEIAGGICLACTMVACLSLFAVAMSGL